MGLWTMATFLLLSTGATGAEEPPLPPLAAEVWSDPEFQQQFLGTYGVASDIEPKPGPVDLELLRRALPLMGDDPAGAVAVLEAGAGPAAGAIVDFTLGNLHFQQDRLEQAASSYAEAVRKFPAFLRAQKNLGLVLVRLGRPAEAIAPLTRSIELGRGDALTYGLLGHAQIAIGQPLVAEGAFRNALLLQPETLDWRIGLLQSVLRQKNYGEAVSLCDELLKSHPERTDLWLLQASAYVGLDRLSKAAENYEVVDLMGQATPQVLFTLGDVYVNLGSWDMAAGAYARAIAKDPAQPPARALAALEVLAQRGATDAAHAVAQAITQHAGDRLTPEEKSSLLHLEARVAMVDGQGGDYVLKLQELVALDPLDGEALLLLGQLHARESRPEEAIFCYERAEGLEPFEAEAKIRHAQVLLTQSRYDEALPLLRRAQEIKPRDEVARLLEQVERFSRTQR